jgi:hypothetical protein
MELAKLRNCSKKQFLRFLVQNRTVPLLEVLGVTSVWPSVIITYEVIEFKQVNSSVDIIQIYHQNFTYFRRSHSDYNDQQNTTAYQNFL